MRGKTFSNKPETELRRLRNILDSAGDGFIMHDLQGNIVDANEALCKELGYSLEELLNLNVTDIDVEATNKLGGVWEKLHSKGSNLVTYGKHKCKDGRLFPVEIKLFTVDYEGTPYISAFIRDITDRKVIEQKLNLTQFAIDHAADAAFWLDATAHKFIYANQKACDILGYTQEELVTMGVPDIDVQFSDDLWPTFVEELKRIYELTFESELIHKDRTIFPVEVTANHMEYEGRSYVIAFVREISVRRKAEKELRDARDKAEKASQAKSEFLTSMSHELKTPLNAIIGYSDMLVTDFSPELLNEQHHFAKSIHQAGIHLLGLIDNVLDLAAIESGKVNLDWDSFCLKEVLEHSIAITKLLADKKGISLELKSPEFDGLEVLADKKKLMQVILNLLSNAIKYNRENGSVVIDYYQEDQQVKINIRDTGYGIPEAKKRQIFSPFSRLGKENSDIEGTGVGLVICKSLIDLMGGSMGFDSKIDEGSCFYFTIPNTEGKSTINDTYTKTV